MINYFKDIRLRYAEIDSNCKTLRKLASTLKISPSRLSMIENAVCFPSMPELRRYHDYFNISYDSLIEYGGRDIQEDIEDDGNEETNVDIDSVVKELTLMMHNDVIYSQVFNFLIKTSSGRIILREISDVLFGINSEDLAARSIVRDTKYGEFHQVVQDDISNKGKILANSFMLLRDPKYRKLSYNDIIMILSRIEEDPVDEYSEVISKYIEEENVDNLDMDDE